MKSALLTTLMLVAVGSHPVFAAQCQFGSCNADTAASIELLVSEIQTNKDEVLKKSMMHHPPATPWLNG